MTVHSFLSFLVHQYIDPAEVVLGVVERDPELLVVGDVYTVPLTVQPRHPEHIVVDCWEDDLDFVFELLVAVASSLVQIEPSDLLQIPVVLLADPQVPEVAFKRN